MADNEQSYESELMQLIDNDDLEAEMQPGQCRTLQARLLKYLEINGLKYSWRQQTLKCEMLSGAKICIFSTPTVLGVYSKFCYYGIILFPWRNSQRIRYLNEHSAKHLFLRLGEEIEKKMKQIN